MNPQNNWQEKVESTHKKIHDSFLNYAKIVAFSLIFPLMIAILVNEGIVLSKMFSWYSQDIEFWTMKNLMAKSLIVFLFPLVYLVWFYHLTLKKTLVRLHKDFIQYLNIDLGHIMAESFIKMKEEGSNGKFNVDAVIMYINEKLSKLPKVLEWIARKIVDQIPIVEFVNSYDVKDLENNDNESLANSFTSKINEFELDLINSMVPGWTMLIIPANIIVILWYVFT